MCFKFLTPKTPKTSEEIERDFHQIAITPYDIERNNCTHKSLEFATFLVHKYHCKDIVFNILPHEDGEYNHAFITWGGRVYDPTSKPSYYNHDYNNYMEIMRREGFQPEKIVQSKLA